MTPTDGDLVRCAWCARQTVVKGSRHAPPEASGYLCPECRGKGAPWTVPEEPEGNPNRGDPAKCDEYTTAAWMTDPALYAALDAVFVFDVDLAASDSDHQHAVYITARENALEEHWPAWGSVGFVNPPKRYALEYLDRAIGFVRKGFTTVALVEMPTHSAEMPRLLSAARYALFLTGRPEFVSPSGLRGRGFGDKGWGVLVFSGRDWPIEDLDLAFWQARLGLIGSTP